MFVFLPAVKISCLKEARTLVPICKQILNDHDLFMLCTRRKLPYLLHGQSTTQKTIKISFFSTVFFSRYVLTCSPAEKGLINQCHQKLSHAIPATM